MDEKLGTMIVDGKIVNLDNMSVEELKNMQNVYQQKEKDLKNEIDRLIEDIDPDQPEDADIF